MVSGIHHIGASLVLLHGLSVIAVSSTNASSCPDNLNCEHLPAECLQCNFNYSCVYGEEVQVTCKPGQGVTCLGGVTNFSRRLVCRFCYQTDPSEHSCIAPIKCPVAATYGRYHETNCTAKQDVLCMGRRQFRMMKLCDWSSGFRWMKALLLSITLGGFGFDRFYLGMWREGLGKLFSFGGLGVWTIVDVILIAIGYVGPSDGSLYV